MLITFSNTTICTDESLAIGRNGPLGMSFNGSPIVDVADFFRAALTTVYGRGDGPEEFSFGVWARFSTEAQALNFSMLHRTVIPVQADLTVMDTARTVALVMANAVRRITIAQVVGVAVFVQYTFIGAGFTSEDIPEDLEEDTDRMKVGSEALSADDETKAVLFASPFASTPRSVQPVVSAPSGGMKITCDLDESLYTAAGFTVRFSYPIPGAGYKLRWTAIL